MEITGKAAEATAQAHGIAGAKLPSRKELAKIRQSAQEFEAIFIETMLKTMRDSVQKSGLIDGGNAEQMYQSMLDSEYAKQMASQGTSGLAADIEKQLLASAGYKSDAAALRTQKLQALAGYQAVSKGKIP